MEGCLFEEFIQDHSTQTYIIVIMGKVPREMPKLLLQVGGRKEGIVSKELPNPMGKTSGKLVIHLWN